MEEAVKPDPVTEWLKETPGDDHLSGTCVATGLEQPTRSAIAEASKDEQSLKLSLFGLAPRGGYRAAVVTHCAGRLLPHRFTLTRHKCRAVCFLWPYPWGRPRSPLTTSLLYGVRTFLHHHPRAATAAILPSPTSIYYFTPSMASLASLSASALSSRIT